MAASNPSFTPAPRSTRLTRREFLVGSTVLALAACSEGSEGSEGSASTTSTAPASTVLAAPVPASSLTADPFLLGVASGDPTPNAIVLWTRLDQAIAGTEPHDLAWDIAADANFTQIVASGNAVAHPDTGHSVHVDVGGLSADARYHYRFRLGDYTSTVGRTRTAPDATSTRPVRFASSTCQNFQQGQYAAHEAMAGDDLDLVIFLGDYIYEDRSLAGGPRKHETEEPETLDAYRARYALYKSDPSLQANHAAHPWIATWDDHEVDNAYAGSSSLYELEEGASQEEFLARRAAAYQAWYENMPVRLAPPEGASIRIYRSFQYGANIGLWVMDGRQYRDPLPTDSVEAEIPVVGKVGAMLLEGQATDPDRTMWGPEQEAWLLGEVGDSEATWTVVAQQVMMHGVNGDPTGGAPAVNVDSWDGYSGARQRVLTGLSEAGAENLVVLSGDFHVASAAELRTYPYDESLPVVGVEFMCAAISSRFTDIPTGMEDVILAFNPQLKAFNPNNGYTRCEVTAEEWRATWVQIDDVADPQSGASDGEQFSVAAGEIASGGLTYLNPPEEG